MKIVFSAQAKAGLRDIALFIAQDNPARARSFVRALRDKAVALADAPYALPIIPRYILERIRRRPFGNYLILYRVDDEALVIVDIVHGARDYDALLFPDG